MLIPDAAIEAMTEVVTEDAKAGGGPVDAGKPILVGELGPEMIMPSSGGHVVNAQRTAQMQAAGLRRGAGSGGAGGGH